MRARGCREDPCRVERSRLLIVEHRAPRFRTIASASTCPPGARGGDCDPMNRAGNSFEPLSPCYDSESRVITAPAPVAQRIERLPPEQKATGSSPVGGTLIYILTSGHALRKPGHATLVVRSPQRSVHRGRPSSGGRTPREQRTARNAPGNIRRNRYGIPHPKPCTSRTWRPNTAIIAAYRTQSPARTEPGARTPYPAPQTRPTTVRAWKPSRSQQSARRGGKG